MATAILEEGTFVRVEPELRKKAEEVVNHFGFSLHDAVNLFLRRVTLSNGLPVDLVAPRPRCLEDMSEEEFDALVQEALDEIDTGLGIPAEELERRLSEKYGIEL